MNETEDLRITPIRRALHRPQQIWGGERELMLFSMLIAAALIIVSLNFFSVVVGLIFWMLCAYSLRKMAKADPIMSKVYMRQIKYRNYYRPYSRPTRVANTRRIY